MRIVLKSRNGVFYRAKIDNSQVEAVLAEARTERDVMKTKKDLEALVLHAHGFSYKEIADALSISKSCAHRRVASGRHRLGAPVPDASSEPRR